MRDRTSTLNIIIAGYIVGGPLGGLVWHHLQYVLGLHKLGHNILFVEDSDDYPSCYNPETHELSNDPGYGLTFIDKIFSQFGLQNYWAYYHMPSNYWYGAGEKKVQEFTRHADVFLNLSGVNPLHERFLNIPVRAFIDTDPVFTQIRHLTESSAMERARHHNRFFTFGENFGNADCSIPDDGFPWHPTRQPVFLSAWNYAPGNQKGNWTTVMQWDSYKTRNYEGKLFGMKSSSFDDYFSLPQSSKESFELALGSATAPKEKLTGMGWQVSDPLVITRSASSYQNYIQQSKGEWSIAKHGYVATHSGWFSERSAGYLASGRPVVVQDTGFTDFIPTGKGLFAFSNPEEVVSAMEEINTNYDAHCRWAREIAEEYFRFDKVLDSLLDNCQLHIITNSK